MKSPEGLAAAQELVSARSTLPLRYLAALRATIETLQQASPPEPPPEAPRDRALHAGPGDHPSGSPQEVHGGDGGGVQDGGAQDGGDEVSAPRTPSMPEWGWGWRDPTPEEKAAWDKTVTRLEQAWAKGPPAWRPPWISPEGTRTEPTVSQVRRHARNVSAHARAETQRAKQTAGIAALEQEGFTTEQASAIQKWAQGTVKPNLASDIGRIQPLGATRRADAIGEESQAILKIGPSVYAPPLRGVWQERSRQELEFGVRLALANIPKQHWFMMTTPSRVGEGPTSYLEAFHLVTNVDEAPERHRGSLQRPFVVGNYREPSVAVNINRLQGSPHIAAQVATHEVGHAFHHSLKDARDDMGLAYLSDVPDQVSLYSKKHPNEAFAEAYAMYAAPAGRVYMEIKYPKTHEYMRRIWEAPPDQWLRAGDRLKRKRGGWAVVGPSGKERELHLGPGDHPSGSPQEAHGSGGGGGGAGDTPPPESAAPRPRAPVGSVVTLAARQVRPTPEEAKGTRPGKCFPGQCYVEAGRYLIDHQGATLVHGTIGDGVTKIGHGWIETDDKVFDGVWQQFYDKADYYAKKHATAEQRYTWDEGLTQMARRQHWGPWGPTAGAVKDPKGLLKKKKALEHAAAEPPDPAPGEYEPSEAEVTLDPELLRLVRRLLGLDEDEAQLDEGDGACTWRTINGHAVCITQGHGEHKRPVGVRNIERHAGKPSQGWGREISYSFPKGGDWSAEPIGQPLDTTTLPREYWDAGWLKQRDMLRQRLPAVDLGPGERLVYRLGRVPSLDDRNAGNLEAVVAHLDLVNKHPIQAGTKLFVYKVKIGRTGPYEPLSGASQKAATEWALDEDDPACNWKTINGHPVCLTSGHGEHGPPVGIRRIRGGEGWESVAYSFPKGGDWTAEHVGRVALAKLPRDFGMLGGLDQYDLLRHLVTPLTRGKTLGPGEKWIYRIGGTTASSTSLDNKNAGNLEALLDHLDNMAEQQVEGGDVVHVFKVKIGRQGRYEGFNRGQPQRGIGYGPKWRQATGGQVMAECRWATFALHLGPGEHPSGSSQEVHGGNGGGPAVAEAAPAPATPKIYARPSDVVEESDWGRKQHVWKSPEGTPTGQLLKSAPRTKQDLPPVLYHVTVNAAAVEESPFLRGQISGGGLGGGASREEGVSFTTSTSDAQLMQRELRRLVQITKHPEQAETLLKSFATQDEAMNDLPAGSLDAAVQAGLDTWRHETPISSHPASPAKDAFTLYLQMRSGVKEGGGYSKIMRAGSTSQLKNPIIFGNGKSWAARQPEDIEIFAVPTANIPDEALITGGSDDWLNEVRAHADVPLKGARRGTRATLHLMELDALRTIHLHMGPGDHPSGSPQEVHGEGGGGGAATSTGLPRDAEKVEAPVADKEEKPKVSPLWYSDTPTLPTDVQGRQGVFTGSPKSVMPTESEAVGCKPGKRFPGDCYAKAAEYLATRKISRDFGGSTLPMEDGVLVHGMVGSGGMKIGHAWVEIGGKVFDGTKQEFYDKDDYYRQMNAEVEHRYTPAEVFRFMVRTKHYGPWEGTAGVVAGPLKRKRRRAA
jgi:hypothetical protein